VDTPSSFSSCFLALSFFVWASIQKGALPLALLCSLLHHTMAASSNKPSPSHKALDTSNTAAESTGAASTKAEGDPLDSDKVRQEAAEEPVAAAQLKKDPSSEDEEPATSPLSYESMQASTRYQVAQTLLQNGDFEDALQTIAEGLEDTKATLLALHGDDDEEAEGLDFHPALAPLHYLYGTTLLYSVEESSSDAMMTTATTNDGDGTPDPDASAEDAQIAFENLDLARIIVEKYLSAANHKSEDRQAASTYNAKHLTLDLAQIRLREGDLQRLNGQYAAALVDYAACAELRDAHLGPYDRKRADVHYNLGLTYALQVAQAAADADSKEQPASGAPLPNVAAAAAAPSSGADEAPALTLAQREEYRRRSAFHYLECGRILCGHLAMAEQLDDAFLRTLVAVDATDPHIMTYARQQLSAWRAHVKAHVAQPDPNLWDVLEEIQETLDEAPASEEGVQQVAHMKAAIAAAAAAEKDDETADSSSAFGSASATAASAAAQPLMAVRKKKRPPPSAQDDAKPAASKQVKPSSE
jgi:hypothetical protein